MEFTKVTCRCCGAPMRVPEGAHRVKCDYCDTEYILHTNESKKDEVKFIDFQGRGPLFRAYIPDGWDCRVTEDQLSISSLAPRCFGLILRSPGLAQLTFLPTAYYKNGDKPFSLLPTVGNAEYPLDAGTLVRYRKFSTLPQYAYERVAALCGTSQIRLEPADTQGMRDLAAAFEQEASQNLQSRVAIEMGKFRLLLVMNGSQYEGYFATMVARVIQRTPARQSTADLLQKGLSFMGAMYGIGMGSANSYDWGRAFDLLLICPSGKSADLGAILDRFMKELSYQPLYYELQDEEAQNVGRIQTQGAMQRQQNAIRASQRLSRTLSETSDIINEGYAERSARMDRMEKNYSEAVRGVNTYTDSQDRHYEADVGFEHIYRDGDRFVGSKDGGLELGPEWEELKKQ